jgi:L-lactate dehydrogenase complex protein LldG
MSAPASPSPAKAEILRRIRAATADVPSAEGAEGWPIPRDYHRSAHPDPAVRIERLVDRLVDYKATVRRVGDAAGVAGAVAEALAAHGAARVLVAAGVPAAWRPADVDLVEDAGFSARELDGFDGTLTGCATAVAETGTIILDGSPLSGRRALTLVPDVHVCVVETGQVVGSVPEAIAFLEERVREQRRPVTLISGPSATSDIELNRVEGVHGPRKLEVVLVG